VPGGAAALLRFGERLVAAASMRPFHELSRGERTLVVLARLCTEASSHATANGCGGASADGLCVGGASGASGASARCGSNDDAAPPAPSGLAIADELTSFVDRPSAATACCATRALWMARSDERRLLCASVHPDVLLHLKPDWAFDTLKGKLTRYLWATEDVEADAATHPHGSAAAGSGCGGEAAGGGEGGGGGVAGGGAPAVDDATLFAPPSIEVLVRQSTPSASERGEQSKQRQKHEVEERAKYNLRMWDLFKGHHYMSGALNQAATVCIARWGSAPVGVIAYLPKPQRLLATDQRLVAREHRLVVRHCPSVRVASPSRPRRQEAGAQF
jgi:hypothetical protein